jgi:hypothetical protein
MNDSSAALAVLTGLAVRLMIPILVTGFIVLVLARLDRRWQTEGSAAPLRVKKPECWKTQHCPAPARKDCPAYASDLPCWQVFRLGSGYLNEKCLACPVLIAAPVPANG